MDVYSTTTPSEEEAVRTRYSAASQRVEPELCCPVEYDRRYLEAVPAEIIERDYGCGDPSAFVRPGDVVLDLGSGGGKICYIASQIAGPTGRVIGVDCNEDMLSLARRHLQDFADRVGYANVEFRRGLIQDLRLDLDRLDAALDESPCRNAADWLRLRGVEERLRSETPMIADDSVDCVLSNCVLNLVRPDDRRRLFAEVFRILKRGGRAAISDIVSDEAVPDAMRRDPELWSGCISGAFQEEEFLEAFERAGFHGLQIAKRSTEPWRVVEGVEFRAITLLAFKGKQGPCLERNQALIYRGPFRTVQDDDGHTYRRGERTAVCDKTFSLLQAEPYEGLFDAVEPHESISIENALEFDCRRSKTRTPRETKGIDYRATTDSDPSCIDGDPCC